MTLGESFKFDAFSKRLSKKFPKLKNGRKKVPPQRSLQSPSPLFFLSFYWERPRNIGKSLNPKGDKIFSNLITLYQSINSLKIYMSEKNALRNFLDSSWAKLRDREHYGDEMLTELEGCVQSCATVGEMMDFLSGFSCPYGIRTLKGPEIPEEDKAFDCQMMVYKYNDEKVPVYVGGEDLSDAESQLRNNFHLLTQDSKEGWKFAIASNLSKWMIYCVDTSIEGAAPSVTEVFEVGEETKERNVLRQLLKDFLQFSFSLWEPCPREMNKKMLHLRKMIFRMQ